MQVGASVMFALGRLSPRRQPGLLIAGSAAGIAAAFNAPLAGIIFGIEEMSRSFEARTSGLILSTVIAAGLTSLGIVGDYTYFGTTPDVLPFGWQWIAVPVTGVAGGLFGGLFSRVLIAFGQGLPGVARPGREGEPDSSSLQPLRARRRALRVRGRWQRLRDRLCRGEIDPARLVAAPLELWADEVRRDDPDLDQRHPRWPVRTLARRRGRHGAEPRTACCPMVPIGVLAVLGMVSYLSGVVQAPITSFVIVSEMTENHALVIPLMICALLANAVSKLVYPHGVYHTLARGYMGLTGVQPEPTAARRGRRGSCRVKLSGAGRRHRALFGRGVPVLGQRRARQVARRIVRGRRTHDAAHRSGPPSCCCR